MATGMTPALLRLTEHPEHIPAVAKLVQDQWGTFSGRTHEETVSRFTGERPAALPTTLILTEGKETLGLGSLRIADSVEWDATVTPWVCNVIVAPERRGSGLGALIVKGLIDVAAELGFGSVYLATRPRSAEFYRRLGFEPFTTVDHWAGKQCLMACATPQRRIETLPTMTAQTFHSEDL